MTTEVAHREFIPGTTGWSVDDLDDPEIERLWCAGRYEIVEGVLTLRSPNDFDAACSLRELIWFAESHAIELGMGDGFAMAVDMILGPHRLAVPNAVFLTRDEMKRQKAAHAATGKREQLKYGRILVPPTLVIESISLGHEAHDRETKRGWYAEAKIPNYWLLDAQQRTLECLVLDGAGYRVDQAGGESDELRPAIFPGLVIPLGKLWAE